MGMPASFRKLFDVGMHASSTFACVMKVMAFIITMVAQVLLKTK